MSELAQPFDVHPTQSKQGKEQRLAGVPEVFDGGGKKAAVSESDVTAWHAKIGQLTPCERLLRGGAQQGRSLAERKPRTDRAHRLSSSSQARLLGRSRGSVSYRRRPPVAAAVALMRQLDALHVEYPFAGSRRLRDLLRQEGSIVGRLPCRHADEALGSGRSIGARPRHTRPPATSLPPLG